MVSGKRSTPKRWCMDGAKGGLKVGGRKWQAIGLVSS